MKDAYPNSPEMWAEQPKPAIDPEVQAAYPNSPEMWSGVSMPPAVDPARASDAFPNSSEMAQGEADATDADSPDEAPAASADLRKLAQTWEQEARNDPEFGGVHFAENLGVARDLVKAHGDDDLKAILNTGLGNNPALIRFLVKVARGRK